MQVNNAALLREKHGNRMDNILNLLGDISSWYHKDENVEAQVKANAFVELGEKLRTGEYAIVMVGEFSAGKSTLLNALMGENMLPAYTNETTATVNFLRHTEQAPQGERGCVFYNDGKQELLASVDCDVIQQYVSTRGSDVVNNISHLDLYLDSEFLHDNVTLVDSPGLNGVAEGHADITHEQILKSHTCIFVFNATQPGSKSNYEFLSQIKSNVGTILFVLNRIDEINASEGDTPESVVSKIQENHQKFFPNSKCPEIWPIAAKPALVARSHALVEYRGQTEFSDDEKSNLLKTSRIQGFETRLMEFLTKGEKTKMQFLEPISRTIEVGNRSKSEIEKEIRLLGQSDDMNEIEKTIVEVQAAIKRSEDELQGCYADILSKVKTGLRDLIEAIEADISRYTESTLSALNDFDTIEDINEYLQNINKKYANHVTTLLEKYDSSLRDSIVEQVLNNYHVFAESIQKSIDGIEDRLNISIELNTREYIFNAGLELMEQQEEAIQKQLEILRAQKEQAEQDNLRAKLNMKEQNKLEKKLRELQEQEQDIKGRIMPAVREKNIKEECPKNFSELGVIGVAREFLVGGPKKVIEVTIIDDELYREEVAKRDAELKDLRQEKVKLGECLNTSAEKDCLVIDADNERIRRKLDYLEGKYVELIRENREKFQNKYNLQIKKIRNELYSLLSDTNEDLIVKVKKILRNQEKKYAGIVSGVIMANLKQALSEEQKKQAVLLKRLNGSEEERDERIGKLTSRLGELEAILLKATHLKIDLEEMSI